MKVVNQTLFEKAKQSNQDVQPSLNETEKQMDIKALEAWQIPSIIASHTEKIIEGDGIPFEGNYHLILPKTDIEQLATYLEETYGLHLKKTVQEVEVEVIRFK